MYTSLFALLGASAAAAAPLVSRQTTHTTSPCSRLNSNVTFYDPSVVQKCLKSIPFREDVRQNIMGATTALYQLAIFQYNQLADSDPALNQGVDIEAEFQRINSTSYDSDYDFQTDLSNVMYSLNDGHHSWQNCYQSVFTTSHAFPIIALKNETGSSNIYLPPDLPIYAVGQGVDQIYAREGINTTTLAGAQVTKINGEDVWDYLLNTAVPNAGTYQDPEQRLNSLFTSYTASGTYGDFAKQLGSFAETYSLDSNNITLTVKLTNGQEADVVVPWITNYSPTSDLVFETGDDVFAAFCLPSSSSTGNSSNTLRLGNAGTGNTTETQTPASTNGTASLEDPSQYPSTEAFIQAVYAACPTTSGQARYPLAQNVNPQASSAYLGGRDIQFYKLNDTQTGVIFVPTFEPAGLSANQDDACTTRYAVDAYLGLQNLTAAGVSRILIDTSNNGGGSVVLTQTLQRLLTGEKYLAEINFETLLRKSPLSEAIVDGHIKNPDLSGTSSFSFYPASFRNSSLTDLSSSTDFFEPGGQKTINNKTLSVSNPVSDSLDEVISIDQLFNVSDAAPFTPENVVFTGNGLCGSACSSFTNFLIEYYNATAYIATARPDQPIEFQAFAAGQVIDSASIYSEATAVGVDSSLLPPLNVVGTFRFALRAALSPNLAPGEFVQYRPYPAQNRYALNAEQYASPLANWEYVASQAWTS